MKGLLSRAERKNGWQMSEILGESTPYKMQQFIYRGRWSADELREVMQDYVKEKFQDASAVLVMDETGKNVSRSTETVQRNSRKNRKLSDRSIHELCSK